MKKTTLALMITTILYSCSSNKKTEKDYFSSFPKTETIQFKEIVEFKKGVPQKLMVIDSNLIISNNYSNVSHFFYNYSLKDNKYKKKYFKKGRGPNEILSSNGGVINNENLFVYDVTIKKIVSTDLSIALDTITKKLKFKEKHLKNYYDEISFINNKTFLATGVENSQNKASLVDLSTENIVRNFGEYKNKPSKIPLDAFKDAYTSYIYLRPSGGKFVIPYRYTDLIEIYNLKDSSFVTRQGPKVFNPDFEVKGRQGNFYMSKTKKTRKAFVSGMVTDEYIYLLFSGHLRTEENWSFGKSIYVYDWDGNPIKEIKLDRYIYTFTVTNDNKEIYAFDENTGYIVHSKIPLK